MPTPFLLTVYFRMNQKFAKKKYRAMFFYCIKAYMKKFSSHAVCLVQFYLFFLGGGRGEAIFDHLAQGKKLLFFCGPFKSIKSCNFLAILLNRKRIVVFFS